MTEKSSGNHPFHQLGLALKQTRLRRRESLAEVSGAVEIDVEMLGEFEKGTRRPSEDLLLLLISHFAIKEDHATKLWELAGYDQQDVPAIHMMNDDNGEIKPMVAVLQLDPRITYTDKVHVMVNNYGVVINFMQSAGSTQPLTIARVGMSKEHAQSVLKILESTLHHSKQHPAKPLSSSESRSEKHTNKDQ